MLNPYVLHVKCNLFYTSDTCTWTREWFSIDTPSTGTGDKETIDEIVKTYKTKACPRPNAVEARRISDKVEVYNSTYPQNIAKLNKYSGFLCLNHEQDDGTACDDYEIRLCCPSKLI